MAHKKSTRSSQRSQAAPSSESRHGHGQGTQPAPASPRGRWTVILIGLLLCALTFWATMYGLKEFARKRRIDDATSQPSPAPSAAAAANAARSEKVHAAFAGSPSCRECHAAEFEKWASSHHANAERAMDAKLDDPAFVPARSFAHGTQSTELARSGSAYKVLALGLGSDKNQPFEAVRAIGVSPLVQYLTPFGGGRLQTLEASYDPHKNEWFNVYGNEDRKPGEWGHWSGRGMNWNSMCAVCHNTRLFKNYDPQTDAYDTRMVELGVGCESCHGPMKDHVQWQKAYGPPPGQYQGKSAAAAAATTQPVKKDPTIKKITRRQMFEACGACHSRRGELTEDFAPGQAYNDHHWLVIPDSSDIFYPDGQIREEDYEYTSFLSSRMFAGGVRCVDCHDPHASKPPLQGNALCMKCHSGSYPNAPIIDPAAHSFHKPEGTGALCINCHMPQTLYMQRHWRHDHGFTIPDPLLTKEHNIPNACNRCHPDKTVDWSIQAVDQWYGARMDRPTRHRARAVALARQGNAAAREPLLKTLKEERIVLWRAVAANVLGNYLASPEVQAALIEATKHADPMVRENAARSLEGLLALRNPDVKQALDKLLEDPVRGVRVRAAWVLRDTLNPQSPAARELMTHLVLTSDQPSGQMQLGLLRQIRGDLPGAVGHFERAVQWDPYSAPFRDALAVGYSSLAERAQNPQEARRYFQRALEQAQQAAQRDPSDAEMRFRLALAHAQLQQVDQTIESLLAALKINPRHARALYNLGLAYAGKGLPDAALQALDRAEQVSPGDPQIPYAAATIWAQKRNVLEARKAALRALQIDPMFPPARSLMQQLGR